MPITATAGRLIEYPLKLTEIEGLENDVLIFNKLKQGDRLEYGPKIYEPWKSFNDMKERLEDTKKELLKDPSRFFNLISPEQAESFKELSEEEQNSLAAYTISRMDDRIMTPQLKELSVTIEKKAVIDLFEKLLAGWSQGFYVDNEGNEKPFSPETKKSAMQDISVDEIMLPALIFVFEESDMRIGDTPFLSKRSLNGKKKRERSKKPNG